MRVRHAAVTAVLVLVVVAAGAYVFMPGIVPLPESTYDRTTVTFATGETVDVRVADTGYKRHVGLSETEALPAGEGMLFVHPREGDHTYVMRGMEFPIDIVFIDADGTVTSIHHAEVPDGSWWDTSYEGHGRYVLEVPLGYTNTTGLEAGDQVEIEGY